MELPHRPSASTYEQRDAIASVIPQTEQSDEHLVHRLAAGDEEAFTALYRRRQGAIYRFVLHMTGSPALADDVTQDVFMAMLRQAHQFDPVRGSVSAYLFGIARYQVLKHLGPHRFESLDVDGHRASGADAMHGGADDPLDAVVRRETIETVRQAVLALPPHYREVVVLCDLQELDYAVAAGMLGYPIGTVRSRLHRGRRLLVEKLRRVATPAVTDLKPARCAP